LSTQTSETPEKFYTNRGYKWLSSRKSPMITDIEISYLTTILRKDEKILDLACGYGRLSIPLASMGHQIERVDITPAFIEKAKKEAKRGRLDIKFRIGNMKDLPYRDESFDSVICMWNAFSELAIKQDQLKAVQEIYRVLKNGGNAIIEVRNHRSCRLIEENFIDGFVAMPSYNHTRGSMKHLMELSGIKSFRIFIDEFGERKRLFPRIDKA